MALTDEGSPAIPKNRVRMNGKPVEAAISRPSTFETERPDKTLYPVSWQAASSRPYEAYRLSEISVAVSLLPLIRPGLRPVHLPRRGRLPPAGAARKENPLLTRGWLGEAETGVGRYWDGPGTAPLPSPGGPPSPRGRLEGPCGFFSSGERSRPGKILPGLRLCSGELWKCCGYPPENRRTGLCKGTG